MAFSLSSVLYFVCVCVVVGGCASEVYYNPLGHSKKFLYTRFLHCFLFYFTYSCTYFGRYNINVLNIEEIHEELNVTATEFGWIITVAFWSYALASSPSGAIVDKIGARYSLLLGSLGCGCINIIAGFVVLLNLRGAAAVVVFCVLYAVNSAFQTFAANAVIAAAGQWYGPKERGRFSGIFGVFVSLGYLMAYAVNGAILSSADWSFCFFIPGALMFVIFFVNLLIVRSSPHEILALESELGTLGIRPNVAIISKMSAASGNNLLAYYKISFCNPYFLILVAVELCLGWVRDGVYTWYVSYLIDFWGQDIDSESFNVAIGWTTLAGMAGPITAGIFSDRVFKSRRPPIAFYFMLGSVLALLLLQYVKAVELAILCLGLLCWFTNGVHVIVTSACALDLAAEGTSGAAMGILNGVQKFSSGLTGSAMGSMIDTWGFEQWPMTMVPPAVVSLVLLAFVFRLPPRHSYPRVHSAYASVEKREDLEISQTGVPSTDGQHRGGQKENQTTESPLISPSEAADLEYCHHPML